MIYFEIFGKGILIGRRLTRLEQEEISQYLNGEKHLQRYPNRKAMLDPRKGRYNGK